MDYSIKDLITEINTHPKERKGFKRAEILSLPNSELTQACELLVSAVELGSQRCVEPLKWILEDQYVPFLKNRIVIFNEGEEKYFFLSSELFRETNDNIYLEQMKSSLLLANEEWEMKSTALGKVLKDAIGPASAYIQYCMQIIRLHCNGALIKTAFIGLLESKQLNPLQNGFNSFQLTLLDGLKSNDPAVKAKAILDVEKIMVS